MPPTPTLTDADLLARLVPFDSTSRNSNLPIADFLCEYLDRPGVRIDRNPSPDGSKVNLVVWFGPAPREDRAGLVLSGHMDVVPAGEAGWRSDPFRLAGEGDRWAAPGGRGRVGAGPVPGASPPATWTAPPPARPAGGATRSGSPTRGTAGWPAAPAT